MDFIYSVQRIIEKKTGELGRGRAREQARPTVRTACALAPAALTAYQAGETCKSSWKGIK